jgi:hypothetical protein
MSIYDGGVLLKNGMASSSLFIPYNAGTYVFQAVYHGDGNYTGSSSDLTTEILVVHPGLGGPQVTTLLSPTSDPQAITLGQYVTDTATVPGLGGLYSTPTGTVEFQVKIGAGAWTTYSIKILTATAPLGGDGVATSAKYYPLTVDTYAFRAIYHPSVGEINYVTGQSLDDQEPLIVGPATPTISTSLGNNLVEGTMKITLGQSVTDNVTVTGLSGYPIPQGTVTFNVYNGAGVLVWTNMQTLNGGTAVSGVFTPMAAGQYYFEAIFAPSDANYTGVTDARGNEPLCVGPATPTISTSLGNLAEDGVMYITLGQSVTDNVTVTGLSGYPIPSGTVTFNVYKDGSVVPMWTDTEPLIQGLTSATAKSAEFTPMAAGQYYFEAKFNSMDANYICVTDAPCNEPLCVGPATPTISTSLGNLAEDGVMYITLGQSVTDNVTVTGLGGLYPIPSGTVTFTVYNETGVVKMIDIETLTAGTTSATAKSAEFTPMAAGMYYFEVVFHSNDANYFGVKGDKSLEPLHVYKQGTIIITNTGTGVILKPE